MREVLFVLLRGFAEWEASPLAAAINQSEEFCVKTVSPSLSPVRSIGGFSVNPDYDIARAMTRDFAGLLLIITAYMILATLMKSLYIRRYHTWL